MKSSTLGFLVFVAILVPLPTCRGNFGGGYFLGFGNDVGVILNQVLQNGGLEQVGKSLMTKYNPLLVTISNTVVVLGYAAHQAQQIHVLSEKVATTRHNSQMTELDKETVKKIVKIMRKDITTLEGILANLTQPLTISENEFELLVDRIHDLTNNVLDATRILEGITQKTLGQIDTAKRVRDETRSQTIWSGFTAFGCFLGYSVMPAVTIPVGIIATASAVSTKFSEMEMAGQVEELRLLHKQLVTFKHVLVEMKGEISSMGFQLKMLRESAKKDREVQLEMLRARLQAEADRNFVLSFILAVIVTIGGSFLIWKFVVRNDNVHPLME